MLCKPSRCPDPVDDHGHNLRRGGHTGRRSRRHINAVNSEQFPCICWSRSNEELVMEAFSDRQSAELIEKLWHYGRYLFICGSSPDSNPFPLYGLWGFQFQSVMLSLPCRFFFLIHIQTYGN